MMTMTDETRSILEEAIEITTERENRHGDIVTTHWTIAQFWSVYLTAVTGHTVRLDPSHAADMLDLFKDARKATGERDRDTYRDGAGYNHCGWVCREFERTRQRDRDLHQDPRQDIPDRVRTTDGDDDEDDDEDGEQETDP